MSWLDDLRPASFRGVAFVVDSHQRMGGRHAVGHEFPLREGWSAEDLGPRQRSYKLKAFVLAAPGGSHFAQRAALNQALDAPGVGTLVHPWLGTLQCYVGTVSQSESAERGGEASWDIEFLDAGQLPSPTLTQDTAAGLLSGLGSWVRQATNDLAIAELVAQRPGVLLGFAAAYVGGLATSLLELGPAIVPQISGLVQAMVATVNAGPGPTTSAITGVTGDPIANAVIDCFTQAATAVVNAVPTAPVDDPVLGISSPILTMPADPSGGLAALAGWTPPVLAANGLQAGLQAQLQQQFTALVQGAATYATATVYAGIDFTTANAATAARAQLLALIQAQITASAAVFDDAATMAWMGLLGLASTDLLQRVQNLPALVPYATRISLPAPRLAQLLYQDGSQADQLAAFNVPAVGLLHPAFLPPAGVSLAST